MSHALLHHTILQRFVDVGHPPSIDLLASLVGQPRAAVVDGLNALADYHGVVLHPGSGEIWAIHPFSAAPTNFWVESSRGGWWGNCAWCSLGIAALLRDDARITTTLGGETAQITIAIRGDGSLLSDGLFVHFPTPMSRAWDNVVYTCSTMLVFDSEPAIERWCARHGIASGDVQPLSNVWEFARVWYGRHLDRDWKKWTAGEAKALFERFGLTGPTWDIAADSDRF